MSNPPLSSLYDAFTGPVLNTAQWNDVTPSSSVVTVVPGLGMAQLACPTAASVFNTLGADGPYDATGGVLAARVTPVLRGNGGTRTIFKLLLDANNSVAMRLEAGVFKFTMQIGGPTVTTTLPAYDPTAHAWWRLREAAGTWYGEVSADGWAWTVLASSAYTWDPTAVGVVLQTSATDVEPAGLFAGFQFLNTASGPGTLMPSWPKIRFGVAFNQGANTAGQPSFVDMSHRIRQTWTAEPSGRQYELDQIQSGQLTLTLWNLDGALDPLNAASPYAPNVLPLRPCRMQAVWPPTRNLLPPGYANGTADAVASWFWFTGTLATGTVVSGAPTGHTTALAWTFPISASGANGRPLLTGTTSSGAEALAFPVTGGQSYTFSLWVNRSAGGDATINLNPKILYYDATGAQVGSTANVSVACPVAPSWAPMSVTGTAPATAVSARVSLWLANTVTTAVNTFFVTAMQLERGTAPTPWTAGGVIYPLWGGFVERWPQQWDKSGTYGLIDITGIDALAALASFTLKPSFQASLQALGPTFMYPFNEPTGSTTFADATGHKQPRGIGASVLGAAGSVTAGSSIQGAGSVGSAGPVVTITNPTTGSGTFTTGRYITGGADTQPPTSGGWTRVVCFRTTAPTPSSGEWQTIWSNTAPAFWSNGTGSRAYFLLAIDSNNHGFGWVANSAGAYILVTVPDIVCNDGNWHVFVVQLSADGKTFTVAVDNHGYQGSSASDVHPSGCVTNAFGALENHSLGTFSDAFSGDLAFATEFPYAIGNVTAFDLGTGFSTGWTGETSAARAQRILNLAGYLGPLKTLDANTAMGGANLADVDAMSALQLVGDTEAGQVYADGANTLWLASRQWRYLQNSPTVTFGENQAAGEVPYLGDVEIELDDTHIYNDATVINQPLPGAPEQPGSNATDPVSQAQYLPKSLQRTINVADPTIPQSAAQYLVGQYAQPLARVGQLTVDAASNPALWSQILPLGFGTRAQVMRRPPPPAPAIAVQQFIESLTWTGDDQGNLKLSTQMSPAQPYLGWWVMASLHTTVSTASTAGTATVTFNPLTGSSLNPASAVLMPGTVLTLGYGTANAENLTVKSVAATVAGYASVAVTFTTNTTHSHAVGEVVCQPLPGAVTLPPAVAAGFPASLDPAATLSATTPRVAY